MSLITAETHIVSAWNLVNDYGMGHYVTVRERFGGLCRTCRGEQ